MNGILCCLGMGSEYNAENHSRRNYNWTITWEQVGWYKIFYFPLGPAPDKSWPGCDLAGTSICSDVFSGEQIKLQGEHRWAWEAGDETWVSLLPTLTGPWGGARFGHLLNVLLENWFMNQWGRTCSDCYKPEGWSWRPVWLSWQVLHLQCADYTNSAAQSRLHLWSYSFCMSESDRPGRTRTNRLVLKELCSFLESQAISIFFLHFPASRSPYISWVLAPFIFIASHSRACLCLVHLSDPLFFFNPVFNLFLKINLTGPFLIAQYNLTSISSVHL